MVIKESSDLTNQPNQMLTTKDVAGILGIHQNTVRRWSDQGFLKSVRITDRGDRRFKYDDIHNFLNRFNGQPEFKR